jgi:hypothetical protein
MRAAGVGPEVTFQEKTVRFAPFSPFLHALFETWLESRVWQSVYRQEPTMPPAEYRELKSETREDIGTDRYAYGGKAFAKASYTAPGLKQALLISLREGTGAKDFEGVKGVAGEKFVHDFFAERQDECRAVLIAIGWLSQEPAKEPAGDAE